MPTTVEYTVELDAPLDVVWAFHEDVSRALPMLSPPESDVRLEQADLPARQGQRVILNVRGPLGVRLRWVADIVAFEPPSGDAGRRTAKFVDVQASGPFSAWRHEHLFEEIDAGRRTRLIDRVTFAAPLGPLGKVAEVLFVRRQVDAMFRHRHAVTRTAVSSTAGVS